MNVDTMADIEADPEPLPDSIADIADEHGVTEAQLRQALRGRSPRGVQVLDHLCHHARTTLRSLIPTLLVLDSVC